MGARKPSAADRTVDMFGAQAPPTEVASKDVEALPEAAKEGRVTLEADVDKMRQTAFTGQEWASKAFPQGEIDESTFRVSKQGDLYYVEALRRTPGAKTAYAYGGVMVHERDLMNMTKVLVEAVRAKQAAGG